MDGPLAASTCQTGVSKNHQEREPSMSEITTIGLDLAKHVPSPQSLTQNRRCGSAPDDAICAGQDGRATGDGTAASWPRATGASAHDASERVAGTSCGVRNGGGAGLAQGR